MKISRRAMVLGLVAASVALPAVLARRAAAQDGPLVITEQASYPSSYELYTEARVER